MSFVKKGCWFPLMNEGILAIKFGARSSGQVPESRSSMANNTTTASSADSFIPYEGREKLKIWNLDIEKDPGWMLKSHLNDALYHGCDMGLKRSIVEIKTYEEFITGNQVRLDWNLPVCITWEPMQKFIILGLDLNNISTQATHVLSFIETVIEVTLQCPAWIFLYVQVPEHH